MMPLRLPIPGIKTIAAIIVAVAIAAFGLWAYKKGQRSVQKDWDRAVAASQIRAQERHIANQDLKDQANENKIKTITSNAASADRARIAAERLRSASEQSIATAQQSHAACVVSASTHAELFNLCEREYRGMAKTADGHATDAKALSEAWPK